jgi:Carbohydrate-selective porin, OprB family
MIRIRIASILFSILILQGLLPVQAALAEEFTDKFVNPEEDAASEQAEEDWPFGEVVVKERRLYLGGTIIGQGTAGVDERILPEGDRAEISSSFDLVFDTKLTDDFWLHAYFYGGAGLGVNDDLPVSSKVSWDGTDKRTIDISELWFRNIFGDDLLALTWGLLFWPVRLDQNRVADNETVYFMAEIFCRNLTIEYPYSSPGLLMAFNPVDWLTLNLGGADAKSGSGNVIEDNFLVAQLDIKPAIGDLIGNYRFIGWINNSDHSEFSNSVTDAAGAGFAVSFDQQLTDWLTLFGRFGMSDENIYTMYQNGSAGLVVSGSLYGRKKDHFGAAYGFTHFSSDWQNATGDNKNNEQHFELYYNIFINRHLAITPDLQMILNAGGDDYDPLYLYAIRSQISF